MRDIKPIIGLLILLFSTILFAKSIKSSQRDDVEMWKDKVLNKKVQLKLLRQVLAQENLDTHYPEIQLSFVNEMSNRYKLYSLIYYIDGVRSYSYVAPDSLESASRTPANTAPTNFTTSLSPGTHQVKVVAYYLGNDSGVFSYLSEYKVRTENVEEVKIERGKNLNVNVFGYEKGSLLTDFKERPAIRITASENLKEDEKSKE